MEILYVLIGAIGSLIGVGITLFFDLKKRRSEEKRWYAEFFLGRKIDALNELHLNLIDCHYSLNQYGNFPPKTKMEYDQEIQVKVDKFLRSKVIASIFLTDVQDEIVSQSLGSFRQASMAIWLNLPKGECPVSKNSYPSEIQNVDWIKFGDSYENSTKLLKEILNPEFLKNVELGNEN